MKPSPDFDPAVSAKKLLRESRSGALATLMPGSGDPYCSLVNVATASDGAPLLLISRLAVHTQNLLADARVSLMLDERRVGNPLEGARVMLQGVAGATDDPAARARYLARQPEAAMFAGFADFAFYRIAIKAAHLVAGFGRIVDLEPQDILTETADASELVAAEPWRCVGCDPEGLELQRDRAALRLAFPQRVRTPGVLRQLLEELAAQASTGNQ
jgi:putative heme iron utilization protein